jgi:hypothetical protein
MFSGLITFVFGMTASLISHGFITIGRCSPVKWEQRRKILILVSFIPVIPIIIYEYLIGHFSSLLWAVVINVWEWECLVIGLFFSDFLMNRGWIVQYIIVDKCLER